MENKDQAIQEAMRLAQSSAGAQLMEKLRQANPQQLQKAMDSAKSGNFAQAQQALSALLEDPQIRALVEKLGGNHG